MDRQHTLTNNQQCRLACSFFLHVTNLGIECLVYLLFNHRIHRHTAGQGDGPRTQNSYSEIIRELLIMKFLGRDLFANLNMACMYGDRH